MFGGDQFIRFSPHKKMQRTRVKNVTCGDRAHNTHAQCYIRGSTHIKKAFSDLKKFKESFIMKLNLLLLSIYYIYYMLHSATQIMLPRARKLGDVCNA
jgi:hypothetical protein